MKYIRTKDRVCEFEMELSTMPDLIAVKGESIGGFVRRKDIVKQADTIEELCDGYYVDKNKEVFIEDEVYESGSDNRIQWLRPYLISCVSKGIDVYAFIKTDKGLIYVAKMNKKGELELL